MKKRFLVIFALPMFPMFSMDKGKNPAGSNWFVKSRSLRVPTSVSEDHSPVDDFFPPEVEDYFGKLCSKRDHSRFFSSDKLVEPEEVFPLEQAVQLMREGDQEWDTWQIWYASPKNKKKGASGAGASQDDAIPAEVDGLWAQREVKDSFECTVHSLKPDRQRTTHTLRFGLKRVPTVTLLKVLERRALAHDRYGSLKLVLQRSDLEVNQERKLCRSLGAVHFTIHKQAKEITGIRGLKRD